MKVLVGCECSQVVCKAFRVAGYEAYSCDVQDCYGGCPEWHIKGDLFTVVDPSDFDLAILHPPCTFLSRINNWRYRSGVPLSTSLSSNLDSARSFFFRCLSFPVPFLAVENPIPHPLSRLPPYSFRLQPYEFGEPWSKCTCFWLRGLPCLLPTCFVVRHSCWTDSPGGYSTVNGLCSKSRKRSETFAGVAAAMASQWGEFVRERI